MAPCGGKGGGSGGEKKKLEFEGDFDGVWICGRLQVVMDGVRMGEDMVRIESSVVEGVPVDRDLQTGIFCGGGSGEPKSRLKGE